MINITESAQEYLLELLSKQESVLGVYIFVNNPGTPKAETTLSYCREEPDLKENTKKMFGGLTAYIENKSEPFLEEAIIDYDQGRMGGQLTIKAPNSKTPNLPEDATLEDRVNYVLWTTVNPKLAMHGGEANLIRVTDENIAILTFGGGCQGCAAVPLTMKFAVEKELLAAVPELAGLEDVTDHSVKDNAYFKEGEV